MFYSCIAFSLFVKIILGDNYIGGSLAGVDQVETVDVTPSQIIVTTTKVGPVESLHVFVDVVDIENGVHLPPMNLSGLLLLITRGNLFKGLLLYIRISRKIHNKLSETFFVVRRRFLQRAESE